MTEKQDASQGSEKKGMRHAAWGIAFVLVFVLAFGVAVRLLWNWLMPEIFGLRTITYLQAIGLLLLSRLLFGRVGQRRDHAGYLTGKYGFNSLFGHGGQESASSDVAKD
jgi:protein-S-isoprenylcysteine O-methyltransferase Ste14